MTSKPASRRRRATTLAPRSWPSIPALATTTLMGRDGWEREEAFSGDTRDTGKASSLASGALEEPGISVFTKHISQGVHDLADGGVGVDGVKDGRDEVGLAEGGFADHLEGAQV